jgi:4-amino-4-deoxy-L-arabinose transferase-like glycosyltransferase
VGDIKAAAVSTPIVDRFGLPLLLLFAFWLRFKLLFAPMRSDEAYSFIEYASHPFYVALSFYNSPNNHTFHTFLMRCSYLLFGNHPWALRLPAFVFGLCLVPAAYMASRSLYRTASGLLTAGLVAGSSPLIDYSTNARGYILLCVITLLSICVAAHALRTRNWASWFLLGILAALGFYTIPIMLYSFGGIALWILSCSLWSEARDRRAIFAGLCFACALGGVLTLELYSPIFAVSGPGAITGNTWVKPARWTVFLHDLPRSFVPTWNQWNTDVPSILAWVLVAGFFAALLFQRRCGRQRVALPIAMVACSVALIMLQRVVFFERLWLFALPIYFVVAAAGLALPFEPLRTRSSYVAALAAIAVALVMGISGLRSQSVYLTNEGRGFEQLAIYLKSDLKPGNTVISVMGCEAAAQYYFQLYHVPLSYLNAPGGNRVLMVVDPIAVNESNMQLMLNYARRTDLDPKASKLVKTFDSLELFEMTRQ